jgi:hypothetical protein
MDNNVTISFVFLISCGNDLAIGCESIILELAVR